MPAAWQPLLDWWFGAGGAAAEVAGQRQRLWFGKRDSQDAEARERFGEWVGQALDGGLGDWAATPDGWLALILLLDQLPRMIYRDSPRAFAGDARAQALVAEGLEKGFEAGLPPIRQVFVYLVLEHAEDLAQQQRSVERFQALLDAAPAAERELFAGFLDYAERHREVIARFGRYPHRNAALGRPSTAEELAYLQEPGAGF
ncbi:DUF924 family protein [Zestomonas carbonaria]|uniref:DUF924 domain-containing protein n=1 Tax=Zestomonas carbonaria TaxID=2762745 RepID=A0A7U7I935_9GAMM|nr:DUF924 family protein [Pseudomonas carbonaria]CAD5107316.1 hypothetical protein PSEWESI4_01587 [Pseudomonas carbonaria]